MGDQTVCIYAVDLGVTGLDYAVVTILFVSQLVAVLRSRRVGPVNVALAALYSTIWLMALLWGPLVLKALSTIYALVIAASVFVVLRKHSRRAG